MANGQSTTHVWDGTNISLDIVGTGVTKYVRGINLIASESGGARKYFLYNAHGDVVQLADASGNAVKRYDYDAFGVEKSPDSNDTNPYRYCGEYFDKETGTVYLRARYYDPVIGRFTQQDTVRFVNQNMPNGQELADPLSLNMYTYCGNNPIIYKDPSGRFFVFGAVVGAIAGAVVGAVSTAITIVASGQSLTDSKSLAKIGVSAATGAVSGALVGSGAVAVAVIGGAAASMVEKKVNNSIDGKKTSATELAISGVAGAVGGLVGASKVSNVLSAGAKMNLSTLTTTVVKASPSVVKPVVVSQVVTKSVTKIATTVVKSVVKNVKK